MNDDLNKYILKKSNETFIEAEINVLCCLNELVSTFFILDELTYHNNMKELYGPEFICGKLINSSKQTLEKESHFATTKWHYRKTFYYTSDGAKICVSTIPEETGYINHLTLSYVFRVCQNNFLNQSVFNVTFVGATKVSDKKNRKHLELIANGLRNLPTTILNRRIMIQQFIDKVMCWVDNACCTGCLKKIFVIFSVPKRCTLCGYNICNKCIVKQKIFQTNRYRIVHICKKCLVRVNHCDYSEVDFNINPYKRVMPDPTNYDAGRNVFSWLTKVPIKVHLVKKMLAVNKLSKGWRQHLYDYLCNHLPLKSCIVASRHLRTYLMDMSSSTNKIVEPINEQQRIFAVNKIDCDKIKLNRYLQDICELINSELDGGITFIAIIKKELVDVVASTDKALIENHSKTESICQHMIMAGVPLLINNPQADIRFCYYTTAIQMGIRFYFSVPVMSPDNYILGSLCIIASNVRLLTRSQYSIMIKMAKVASKVISTASKSL